MQHAAGLASMLPANSRTFRAIEPSLAWGEQERLLASVVYLLEVMVWQKTKDGHKNRNKPKPPQPPGKYKVTTKDTAMTQEDYDNFASRPRKEVQHG